MNKLDIDKAFVSTYDRFLFEFDRDHEKTPSQLKEIEKHRRIAEFRDSVVRPQEETIDWEGF
jgi:hypothetical protein